MTVACIVLYQYYISINIKQLDSYLFLPSTNISKLTHPEYLILFFFFKKIIKENFFVSIIFIMTDIRQPEFLDLLQIDPDAFNKSQQEKQDEIRKTQGDEAYRKIMWSDKHHPLKSTRYY